MRPVGEIVVVVGMEVVKVSSACMYCRDAMVIMTHGRRVESCIFSIVWWLVQNWFAIAKK